MEMEPLRVLELYSGIGGMHQALRGEEHTPPLPTFTPPRCSQPGCGGGAKRRDAGGGEWRGRGRSVVLETAPARRPRPALRAETPFLPPRAMPEGRAPSLGGLRL